MKHILFLLILPLAFFNCKNEKNASDADINILITSRLYPSEFRKPTLDVLQVFDITADTDRLT